MTAKTVRDKLIELLDDAYGFEVVYSTLPTTEPSRLPALLVKWQGSTVETFSFSRLGANQAKRATHKFEVVALISKSGQVGPLEDARLDAVNGILVGVNNYSTLQGTVAEAQIETIAPESFGWNDVVVYGITAVVSVTEEF